MLDEPLKINEKYINREEMGKNELKLYKFTPICIPRVHHLSARSLPLFDEISRMVVFHSNHFSGCSHSIISCFVGGDVELMLKSSRKTKQKMKRTGGRFQHPTQWPEAMSYFRHTRVRLVERSRVVPSRIRHCTTIPLYFSIFIYIGNANRGVGRNDNHPLGLCVVDDGIRK